MGVVGPFESYEPDHTVAGLEIDVISTPGQATYSVPGEPALFSGDLLFQGAVGRTDLPASDAPTLMESIRKLVEGRLPEITVYPGHMGSPPFGGGAAVEPVPR